MATSKPSAPIAQLLLAGLFRCLGARYGDAAMIAAGTRNASPAPKGSIAPLPR
jgi:hypothetical protein